MSADPAITITLHERDIPTPWAFAGQKTPTMLHEFVRDSRCSHRRQWAMYVCKHCGQVADVHVRWGYASSFTAPGCTRKRTQEGT